MATINLSVSVKEDPTPGMPFSMIEGMMPKFPMIAIVGWMIVLISFLIGYTSFSGAVATFFGADKATREGTGSQFIEANTNIHVIEAWLPNFKFLGLGLGLLAITMALGLIAKNLRIMGKVVNAHLPDNVRPPIPEIPRRVKIMQMSAMMGLMILVISFIIGLVLAFGSVSAYWSVAITTLNGYTGANLAASGGVKSFNLWLGPLRLVGMAFLFVAITIALTVIINTLKLQEKLLKEVASK